MRIFLFFMLTALCISAGFADTAPTPKDKVAPKTTLPEPPPPPENYNPPAAPETGGDQPTVTITTKGTEIHEEHRMNGRLYMIKVTPAKGKPYYLIDQEGNGQFRRSDLETRISVPMWVIKRF
ncbi:MAG: DUF2782 domain-containing protein [Gammaproteobacteria bacterium]|nr:DUF2782 domain-containing protein [Gammaproteobacteria bacterium]